MKSRSGSAAALLLAIWLNHCGGTPTAMAAEAAAPTVGIEGQVVLALPGTALKTIPTDPKAPVTVRIADAQRRGTLTQYDFRYIGQVPGTYDLRKYLAREDGSPTSDLPAIEVRVTALLPPDHMGQLALRDEQRLPSMDGYRWLMIGAGIVWAGMVIPFWLNRRKNVTNSKEESVAPLSTADRLRPLIAQATAGKISADEKAQLERLLLSHWRERLSLDAVDPAAAMVQLRAHAEAGVLLRTLEDWLHRPPGTAAVDLERFLAPYSQAAPTPAAGQSTPASA